MKFKIGDKVKRVRGNWGGMEVGDEDIIINQISSIIKLEKYYDGHDAGNFELAFTTWKERYGGKDEI